MNITGNNHSGIYGGIIANPSGAIDADTINGFQLNRCNISGNGDTNISLPDETGVDLYNLVGTAAAGSNPTSITNTVISNNFEFELQIINNVGTLTSLAMSGNTISSNGATGFHGNLVNFLALGTANMRLDITGGTFTGAAPATATGVQCDHSGAAGTMTCNIFGATFTNNNVGPQASVAGGGQMVFDFNNNNIQGSRAIGVNVFADANPPFTKSLMGRVRNNTIGSATINSGAELGNMIRLQNEGRIAATVAITGNILRSATLTAINVNHGISLLAGTAASNVTITGNTISDVTNGRAVSVQANDFLPAGGNAGTVCTDIAGNTMNSNIAGAGGDGTRIRVRQSASSAPSVFNVRQRVATAGAIATELDDANGFNNPAQVSVFGAPTYNAGACPQPSN